MSGGLRTLLAGLCGECDRHDHVLGGRAKLLRHLVGGGLVHLVVELARCVSQVLCGRWGEETHVETAAGLEGADREIDVEVLRVVRA